MSAIKIPARFVEEFIAYANENSSDGNELDLRVSSDRRVLHLSNNSPGYRPYLQITEVANKVTVEICSTETIREEDGSLVEAEFADADISVALANPSEAARLAVQCWLGTL